MAKISSGVSNTQLKRLTQQVGQVRQQATRLSQRRRQRGGSTGLDVGFQRSVEGLGRQVERYRQQVPQLARQEQDRLNKVVSETQRAIQTSAATSVQIPQGFVGGGGSPPTKPSQGSQLSAQLAAVRAELQALREELNRFQEERKALQEEIRRLESELERLFNHNEPQNWALLNTAMAYTKLVLQITLQEIQRLETEIYFLELDEALLLQRQQDLHDLYKDRGPGQAASPGGLTRTRLPSAAPARTVHSTMKPTLLGRPPSSPGKLS